MTEVTIGIVIRAVVFSGSWGAMEKGMGQEPSSKSLKKPFDISLAPVILMCSHSSENHWPRQFLHDGLLPMYSISLLAQHTHNMQNQICYFLRALCYHWWCFVYFYPASKKIYSSGLLLPARHYRIDQWRGLPQLRRSYSQLPKTLWCCNWYWAFSE